LRLWHAVLAAHLHTFFGFRVGFGLAVSVAGVLMAIPFRVALLSFAAHQERHSDNGRQGNGFQSGLSIHGQILTCWLKVL
jgi:hypothetical protein